MLCCRIILLITTLSSSVPLLTYHAVPLGPFGDRQSESPSYRLAEKPSEQRRPGRSASFVNASANDSCIRFQQSKYTRLQVRHYYATHLGRVRSVYHIERAISQQSYHLVTWIIPISSISYLLWDKGIIPDSMVERSKSWQLRL